MSAKTYAVDIDLSHNQLLNATLQNLATHPASNLVRIGFIYWNTTTKTAFTYTGLSTPNDWLDLGAMYTHPTFTARNLSLTGAKVLSVMTVDSEGHIVDVTTRDLTVTDIGAAPAIHSHSLSNISDVTATAAEVNLLDLAGLTTGWVLRATSATTAAWGKLLGSQLTNDLSWVSIADGLTNLTNTWSSTKIQSALDTINSQIVGGLVNKGGYNAATNAPNLDATPIAGIKNGWVYTVTGAGDFFNSSNPLSVGDMIIANQDSPTTVAHWTIVNKNIPDIVQATTSAQGIIQLATSTEVQTGTDADKAVTSATLSARTATTTRTGILSLATSAEGIAGTDSNKAITSAVLKAVLDARTGGYAANFGDGVATTFNITHALNTLDVTVEIVTVATGTTIEMQVTRTSTSVIKIDCNVAPTSNQYRVVIKK